MDRIIKDILNYMAEGYSINEVVETMKKDIDTEFRGDVDKFYLLVSNTFEKAKKKMPSEEYEKIKVLRKERSERLKLEAYKKVADKVKELTLEMEKKGLSLKDALAYAVTAVANYEGLSNAVVRNYTKTVEPEFYDYYFNNRNITPEYFEDMANRIIAKNMYESVAARMQFYPRMIEYLEVNNPELLAEMRTVFRSHKINNEQLFNDTIKVADRVFKDSKTRLIAEIAVEYRVPLVTLTNFVNANVEYFCNNNNSKTVDEVAMGLRQIKISQLEDGIKWYLYEVVRENEYTSKSIERFKIFAEEFLKVRMVEGDLEKFVLQHTYVNITAIKNKLQNRKSGDDYNLTPDESRIIAKYVYKFGLSGEGISSILSLPHFHKTRLIELLQRSGMPYDLYLASRLMELSEYQMDLYNNTNVGRLK